MLQKYERKAEDILEKLGQEEPNERNFQMMANALVILAGAKGMEILGGQMENYDGRRMEYARGGRGGRGRTRVSGYTRRRYDGGMEDDMMDEFEEDAYYDGGSRYDGQSGRSGGGRSGGMSGGSRSGGGR